MKKLSNKRGITLIEIMTIVVVVGIVSALAIPRFAITLKRLQFKASAKGVLSTMRLARSNAITNKRPFGVYFNNTDRTFTLFQDTNSPALRSFESSDLVISVDSLPEHCIKLVTDFGNESIVYQPNGSASASGKVLMMSHSVDDDINIGLFEILASTGRTKLASITYY